VHGPSLLSLAVLLEEGFASCLVDFLGEYHAEEFDGFVEFEVADEVDVVDLFGHVAGDAAFFPHFDEGAFEELLVGFEVAADGLLYFEVKDPVLFEVVFAEEADQIGLFV
jgi:hypothetical protein